MDTDNDRKNDEIKHIYPLTYFFSRGDGITENRKVIVTRWSTLYLSLIVEHLRLELIFCFFTDRNGSEVSK